MKKTSKILISGAVIACCLMLSLSIARSSEIDSLTQVAKEYYLNKKIVIDTLTPNKFIDLIRKHVEFSPSMKSIVASNKSGDLYSQSVAASFNPSLLFNLGNTGYDSYSRQVIVRDNVPVEWDQNNPIISNINLPNGGQGIIWLPRPIAYAQRDIFIDASYKYFDHIWNSSVGLNYKFPFGLSVNALNYKLGLRTEPKTYDYGWSAVISNSLSMPLFNGFGWENQPEYVAIQKAKIQQQINDNTLESIQKSTLAELSINFFNLYFNLKKIDHLIKLRQYLSEQLEDINLLIEQKRLTVTDYLQTVSQSRQIESMVQDTRNKILYYSSLLNVNFAESSTFYLYIPDISNADEFLKYLDAQLSDYLNRGDQENFFEHHWQIANSKSNLSSSEIDLKIADNQTEPQVQLTGSISAFESSTYGYKRITDALFKSVTKPDGYTWNVGMQYIFSFGDAAKLNFQSALANVEANQFQLASVKLNLEKNYTNYVFLLKSNRKSITLAENNLSDSRAIFDKQAAPLYEKQRINRYDYDSYLKDVVNSGMSLNDARLNYIQTFLGFLRDMDLDFKNVIKFLK